MTIVDRDKGFKALVKRVAAVAGNGKTLTVGVFGDAKGDRARIATYNEFGTDRIPARSFLRAWFDANKAQNDARIKQVAQGVLAGKYTAAVGLEKLGLLFVGEIQKRIASGIGPPNAESTVARKGSSRALVDTGLLRSSITARVSS